MNENYVYVKLLPVSTITNEKTDSIASRVNLLYNNINKSKKKNSLLDSNKYKLSFMINIKKETIVFYAIVPKFFLSEFETLCESAWKGINIELLDSFPISYEENYTMSTISTKESDCLSLRTDKRDNFLLASILSTSNLLKENEDVTIMYNFIPSSRMVLKSARGRMIDDLDRYSKNYTVKKNKTFLDVTKNVAKIAFQYTGEVVEDVAKDFGVKVRSANETDRYTKINTISECTKNKEKNELINTQILILSNSNGDKNRQDNINSYVADNFERVKGDNSLIAKTKFIKKHEKKSRAFDFTKYKYEAPTSMLSSLECQHLISLPGSTLMKEYKQIENIPYKQLNIPNYVSNGYLSAGTGNDRGNRKQIKFSNEDKEIATKGVFMLGPQGSGKSTFMKHYMCDALTNEDLIILYDYIGNNEFARDVERLLPKKYYDIIDLSITKGDKAQSIAYNELDVKHIKRSNYKTTEDWQDAVCDCIASYAEQIIFLMQSVNSEGTTGAEFTNRMKKIIKGAAILTFSQPNKTIMNMYNILIDHVERHKAYDNLPDFVKKDFKLDIKEFLSVVDLDKIELDPITKKPKLDENGEPKKIILGTQEGSITFLLDRFYPFRSNRKLRLLAEKSPENNIDFADIFLNAKKKVIIIKIPDEAFQGPSKDIICNFYANKILTAMKIRQSRYVKKNPDDPKGFNMTMAHVMFDELYILKSTVYLIKEWLTQFRKFRVKPFFTGHGMGQLPIVVADAIKQAGYNYIITGPLDNKTFEAVHEFFPEFNAEQCSNLIQRQYMLSLQYKDGKKNFIVKAPGDVTTEGHPILKNIK